VIVVVLAVSAAGGESVMSETVSVSPDSSRWPTSTL
jgi:hypothetical protein